MRRWGRCLLLLGEVTFQVRDTVEVDGKVLGRNMRGNAGECEERMKRSIGLVDTSRPVSGG
jgi:hypothetical protein